MPTVIGVRFHRAGQLYFFESGSLKLRIGDPVVVRIDGGVAIGRVVLEPRELDYWTGDELKRVVRKADEKDLAIAESLKSKEKFAFELCKQKIEELGLPMNLVGVEYILSGNKAFFYFTADGRVDFRQLVRELARVLKIRIEMRQIGVRDETKLLGGIGLCGRELCCTRFLTRFSQVTIKMAKEQNMSLSPEKVSGICGRLLCCLNFEDAFYKEMLEGLPKVGKRIKLPQGDAKIQEINVFSKTVSVEFVGDVEPKTAKLDLDKLRKYLEGEEIHAEELIHHEEPELAPVEIAKEAVEDLEKEIDDKYKKHRKQETKKRKPRQRTQSNAKAQPSSASKQSRQSRRKQQQPRSRQKPKRGKKR